MKRKDLFPCDLDDTFDILEDQANDYSDRKELGHARIPQICTLPHKESLVDRCTGEKFGLVDGDYIIFELPSKARGTRIYADVCLRGMKGMHLPELSMMRARKNTWKFCFYQGIIALLAKTQLRYLLNIYFIKYQFFFKFSFLIRILNESKINILIKIYIPFQLIYSNIYQAFNIKKF